jgi:tetratricopeptide (TPR) repeat protein
VKQLLAGPREGWAAKLEAHPEWRTAGTVRKLIAATDRYNFSSPLDAVELTRLTVEVAESLPADAVATRERLAADAWREYAYALLVTGAYDAATVALVHAECCASERLQYANARNSLMRALVLRGKEQWADAVRLSRAAAAEFLRYGDVPKYCSARMAEAITLYDSNQLREAVTVYDDLRPHHLQLTPETVVLAIHNEGLCHRELSDFERAERCFVEAVTLAEELNMQGLRSKARWHLARTLMRQGKYDAALKLLDPVRRDLQELGLAHDVACSALDVAECLLATDRAAEVDALCRTATSYFKRVALQYSTGAMTALAYVQEAAASRRLRVQDLATVRVFVESLRKTPQLLFAPPSDS